MYIRTKFTACIQFNNFGTDMDLLLFINKTYRMKTCVAVLFCWLIINPLFSQEETNWMNFDKRMALDKVMNMEYTHPEGFIGDNTTFFCSPITGFIDLAGSMAVKDRSFMVLYKILNPVNEDDTVRYAGDGHVADMGHYHFINDIVKYSFGNDADWKDYVHYYPSEEAKNRFNADTVFSVSLLLNKAHCFSNIDLTDYSHCTVLIIQKEGRGYVATYCFYNENTTENLSVYMSAIEETLKYREGKPELKKWEGERVTVRVIATQPRMPVAQ